MRWEYKMFVSESFKSNQTTPPDVTQVTEGTKFVMRRENPVWSEITKLGEAGWELVNAFPTEWDGSTHNVVFLFKRPKESV